MNFHIHVWFGYFFQKGTSRALRKNGISTKNFEGAHNPPAPEGLKLHKNVT